MRNNVHLYVAGHLVWKDSLRHGAPGVVSHYAQGMGAIREDAARTAIGQDEGNQRSGNRPVVLVIHLNRGFPRHALADIVDGSFSLENRNIQSRGRRSLSGSGRAGGKRIGGGLNRGHLNGLRNAGRDGSPRNARAPDFHGLARAARERRPPQFIPDRGVLIGQVEFAITRFQLAGRHEGGCAGRVGIECKRHAGTHAGHKHAGRAANFRGATLRGNGNAVWSGDFHLHDGLPYRGSDA